MAAEIRTVSEPDAEYSGPYQFKIGGVCFEVRRDKRYFFLDDIAAAESTEFDSYSDLLKCVERIRKYVERIRK